MPGNIQWGKVRPNVSIVGESWFVAVSPGRRMSQEQLGRAPTFLLLPTSCTPGFLLSTETTTSLSLAAIALHLLEVGQHEREAGFNRRQMAGKGDGDG